MSLPYYDISCTNCYYHEKYSFNVWYEYVDGRKAVCKPVITQGWCEECQRVLTIYVPLTKELIQDDIERLNKWVEEEEEKRENRKLLFFKQKIDEELIDKWKNKIFELNRCAEFFSENQLKEKCLTCGSENVALIQLPSDYDETISVGIKHHCGGNIIAARAGRISYGNLPKVIYDISGNILHDER